MADPGIVDALDSASGRGVKVRVILPQGASTGSQGGRYVPELRSKGVQVEQVNSTAPGSLYMHAKVVLADHGSSVSQGFVGSENFSRQSLDYNRELGILLGPAKDKSILDRLSNVFQSDWSKYQPAINQ